MGVFQNYKDLLKKADEKISKLQQKHENGRATLDDVEQAIFATERLALSVRQYDKAYFGPDYQKVKLAAKDIIKEYSRISYEVLDNDHIVLHFPKLANKKVIGERRFLYEPLSMILEEIKNGYGIEKRSDRVVVFEHHLSTEIKEQRKAVDYDNIDVSVIINALTEVILFNDSPYWYSLYHTYKPVEAGEEQRTDVLILSKENFKKYIKEEGAN